MGYGRGSITSTDVNRHKMMAGATDKGNFGVDKYPGRVYAHPDAGMSHEPMDDGARMKSTGKQQAAPDHAFGKGHVDHFQRGGKV